MDGWMRGMGVLGAAVALGGCAFPLSVDINNDISVTGSGHVVTETRSVRPFDAIAASGGIRVIVTRTGRERVTITAEDNLLSYLRAEVHNGVLELGPEPGVSLSPRKEIVVRVESYEVVELSASGAVFMEAELGWVEELWVTVSGASSVAVWGAADRSDIGASGASSFDGLDLETRHAHTTASGASEALVWVLDRLDVDASGASRVRFRGNPVVAARVSGASTVTRW